MWTDAERSAFVKKLPFKESTFSKYVRIGSDKRLYRAEVRQLLPPHYTTLYALALLEDAEFDLALADVLIHPGLEREELLEWRRAQKTSGAGASRLGAASKSDQMTAGNASELAVDDTVAPGPSSDEAKASPTELSKLPPATAAVEAESPSIAPEGNDTIPPFLDRRLLSPEEERDLSVLINTYDAASEVVQLRFKQHLGVGASNA